MTRRQPDRRVWAWCCAVVPGGVWLAHTAEYVRVAGTSGLRDELFTPPHAYMLPAGVVLALCVGAGCLRVWEACAALRRRIDVLRAALPGVWRRRAPFIEPVRRERPPACPRPCSLWAGLTVLQILLYVLQENLEAAVARRPPPGLATVTGVHWAAPVVHAAVALALATLLVTLTRLLRARRHSAAAVERLFAALTRHLLRTGERPGAAPWTPSPLDRLGRQLLRRPPPPLVAG